MRLPETADKTTAKLFGSTLRRRAAAYARVSTDHEDQAASCSAQIEYYTKYIRERDDLEFVRVYVDEGISGTSTAKRAGFRQMINDALAGEIDLIITKSVSRFARNTVDGLSTIRLLKANNVECYFERENIRTFDGKAELLLTIMASIAQEESRSISENCLWGQHKRFADGKVTVPFKRFLGYDRAEDGSLTVNPEQAEIVREIYGLFLEGMSPYGIAKLLTERNIPAPSGGRTWYKATITSILSNEKYKGDALLQKVFTTDYLTKRKKRNEGELPQYYVEGDHEAIISAEIFERAQKELERRSKRSFGEAENALTSTAELMLPKLICAECECGYSARVLYSTQKYRKTVFQCGSGHKCDSPRLVEAEVTRIFLTAVNFLLQEKESIISKCANYTKRLSISAIPPEKFPAIRQKMRKFRKTLKELTELPHDFDAQLWNELIESITAYSERRFTVKFIDGSEFNVEI